MASQMECDGNYHAPQVRRVILMNDPSYLNAKQPCPYFVLRVASNISLATLAQEQSRLSITTSSPVPTLDTWQVHITNTFSWQLV